LHNAQSTAVRSYVTHVCWRATVRVALLNIAGERPSKKARCRLNRYILHCEISEDRSALCSVTTQYHSATTSKDLCLRIYMHSLGALVRKHVLLR